MTSLPSIATLVTSLQFTPLALHSTQEASSKEENPPQWPSSVHVFDDNPDTIQQVNATIMDTFAVLGPLETGKFSSERVAFLFKPGRYELDVPVGYYTQVAQLWLIVAVYGLFYFQVMDRLYLEGFCLESVGHWPGSAAKRCILHWYAGTVWAQRG